jgi:large subunit ribosomal protein L29
MAIIKKKQLKELGNEDMQKKLAELELEIQRETAQKHTSGRPGNPGKLAESRKLKARIKTLLSQRGLKV